MSGQDINNLRSNSPTFNKFRNNPILIDQVKAYADTIYPRGDNLTINNSELLIVWGLTEENTYHLAYKIDFWKSSKSHSAWINANNGKILKQISLAMDLEAPTSEYYTW